MSGDWDRTSTISGLGTSEKKVRKIAGVGVPLGMFSLGPRFLGGCGPAITVHWSEGSP